MKRLSMKGFSLAEVLLAMGMYSVAAMSVVGLLVSNFSVQAKSEQVVTASHLGESVLDEWKSRPYSELAAQVGRAPLTETKSVGLTTYACALSAEPLKPSALNPSGETLLVSVEVNWMEKTQLNKNGTRGQGTGNFRLQSVVTPGASL
jgi:hypothetical protein